MSTCTSNKGFRDIWMTEESLGTRGRTIGARLKYYDKIARLGVRHRHSIREQIQRSAERADDGNDCTRSIGDMICNAGRVVLPDYLAKVPGGREMVV